MRAASESVATVEFGDEMTPCKLSVYSIVWIACWLFVLPVGFLVALWISGDEPDIRWLVFTALVISANAALVRFAKRTRATRLFKRGALTDQGWLQWNTVQSIDVRLSGFGPVIRIGDQYETLEIHLGVFKKPKLAMQLIESHLPSHLALPEWVVKRFKLPSERASPRVPAGE